MPKMFLTADESHLEYGAGGARRVRDVPAAAESLAGEQSEQDSGRVTEWEGRWP